jgi:hypothetical protein
VARNVLARLRAASRLLQAIDLVNRLLQAIDLVNQSAELGPIEQIEHVALSREKLERDAARGGCELRCFFEGDFTLRDYLQRERDGNAQASDAARLVIDFGLARQGTAEFVHGVRLKLL